MNRRRFLHGTLTAALSTHLPALQAQAQQPSGALAFLQSLLQDGSRFDASKVTEAARLLAARPYTPPNLTLPEPFSGMNAETYAGIQHRPERLIWGDDPRGFMIEPLHRGSVFAAPVSISVVEDGTVRSIVYDAGRYSFGKLAAPANTPDIGFSGFRLHAAGESAREAKGEATGEAATFQGGTFFRSLAKGQRPGAMARAVAIKTGDPRGEEFPLFRAFWIERPTSSGMIVIHAVADSESATAAFRFTLRRGDVTIIDAETTVFARTAIDHIGFGCVQGTFLFGANRRRSVDDLRPAVHDTNGLQMLTGRGEWIWRPLNNPGELQISSFMDENPKAFGLVQRDRDFGSYQDDDNRYDLRPTLWVEPIGDWGQGSVQLTEIPSDSEINDNIVVYWRPRAALAAGSQTSFAYRQFWAWHPPERNELAITSTFRVGRGSTARRRRFLVEFAGDSLAAENTADFRLALNAFSGQIVSQRVIFNAMRKTARVLFELDPGSETAVELRLALYEGEKQLTETWLYRWTQ
ncbi:MAG: glucan biosynthesis protein [Beijerinckiaceae bacterium]